MYKDESPLSILLGQSPEAELLGQMVTACLTVREAVTPLHVSSSSAEGFQFPHSLASICYFVFLDKSHRDGCAVGSQHGFNISLISSDGQDLFVCLMAICISCLKKCLFNFFAQFLTGLFGFVVVELCFIYSGC